MRLTGSFVASLALLGLMLGALMHGANAQTGQAPSTVGERAAEKSPDQPRQPTGQTPAASPASPPAPTLWDAVTGKPKQSIALVLAMAVFVIGVGILLYFASGSSQDSFILKLGPSFFLWLGMGYLGLLLLGGGAYLALYPNGQSYLIGGTLPIGVPWFGALGAVTISLEGVFLNNSQWDAKYNYWHIGRPLFGGVLGIVAFFLFVVIVTASNTTPGFLTDPTKTPAAKDLVVFYMVGFLVGYREETFRELIKRVTDLILKPATQPARSPKVTFKGAGVTPLEVGLPPTGASATSQLTIEIQNTGDAPLMAPAVAVSATATTLAGTFGVVNDRVTGGGDLAPGQAGKVDLEFRPQAVGSFSGTLSVTATNLSNPRTIRISGKGQ